MRAAELPLDCLREPPADAVRDEQDLADPWNSYVVAEGWLLREIETANVALAHASVVTAEDADSELVMQLKLPVSKSDTQGFGVKRRLRCSCEGVGGAPRVLRYLPSCFRDRA